MFTQLNPSWNLKFDWQMDIDTPPFQRDELDLGYSIRGMYRILDLISEQGSGGLGEYPSRTGAVELICYQSIRSLYLKIRSRHS